MTRSKEAEHELPRTKVHRAGVKTLNRERLARWRSRIMGEKATNTDLALGIIALMVIAAAMGALLPHDQKTELSAHPLLEQAP